MAALAEEARAAEEAPAAQANAHMFHETSGPDVVGVGGVDESVDAADTSFATEAEEAQETKGDAVDTPAEVEAPVDPAAPPPPLEPEAVTAFQAALLEIPLDLHAALLKQSFNYEAGNLLRTSSRPMYDLLLLLSSARLHWHSGAW